MAVTPDNCHRKMVRKAGLMGAIVRETVKVVSLERNRVTVEPMSTPVMSEGCASCKLCSTDTKKKVSFSLRFGTDPDFKKGDVIIVERFAPNELAASILSFGFPLLFVLGVQFGAFYSGYNGESPLIVLLTAIVFFAGFLVGPLVELFFYRRYPARRVMEQ